MARVDEVTEFATVRRGYDMEAVDGFISDARREFERDLAAAQKEIHDLKSQLDDARKREEAIHLTFVAATKTKDELIEQAERQLSEAKAQAKEEADRIVSEAQYEAFRLVTEARDEAEATLAEARSESESALDGARSQANEMLSEARHENRSLVEERERLLAEARQEVNEDYGEVVARMERLQRITNELEMRFSNYASGILGELGDLRGSVAESFQEALGTGADLPAPEQSAEPIDDVPPSEPPVPQPDSGYPTREVLTDSTEVTEEPTNEEEESETAPDERVAVRQPPPPPTDEELNAELGAPRRGSFYSRRSARLPRIGADAASDAMDVVSAMRGRMRETMEEEEADDAESADVVTQTA